MTDWDVPALIKIPAFHDELGALGVIEKKDVFPYDIKRVYFIYDVPPHAVRGSHAHKELKQLIIALSGSFTVTLDDGNVSRDFVLDSPDKGLTVPPGYWRTLTSFTAGAAALVLASEEYTPSDYIRDYDEFVAWAKS